MLEKAKKRSRLCQISYAKERSRLFKKYVREAIGTAYLTYDSETDDYKKYVTAIYYKIVLLNRVTRMASWFCSSCFSFTLGSKKKHRELGHPERDAKSASFINRELGEGRSTRTFAEYLQKEAEKIAEHGLEVKKFSLPSINRPHNREERRCCHQMQKQNQALRDQVQSLIRTNERLRRKERKLITRLGWATFFARLQGKELYESSDDMDLSE